MSKKHDIEYIRKKSKEYGFEFLSDEYENNHTKYPFKCSKGHIYSITWKDLEKRKNCTICSNIKKSMDKTNSYDKVKKDIERDKKFILISKKYNGNKEIIEIKCLEGNHIFPIQYDNFQQRRRCPICSNIKKVEKRRHDYELVKEEFEERKWILLSKEYKNSSENLDALCDKGHFCRISYGNFHQGKGCKICWFKRMPEALSHDYEFIKKEFENRGEELLSNEYKGNKDKLKAKCKNGHTYYPTYDSFHAGHGCPTCSHITSKAETEISEFIKSLNLDSEILIKDKNIIKPLELDIVIVSHKLAIEYN